MQIPRFNLIIYNSRNLEDSYNLISSDVIIHSRALTYSSVVRFYSFRALACCSLGALYGSTLGAYDGTELGSPDVSTEGTTGGKIEGLLLGD